MTFLTVTHDRAFLEDVCNTILELDRGTFYTYVGSYAKYLEGKEERLANEDQAYREGKAKLKKECECVCVLFVCLTFYSVILRYMYASLLYSL